MGKFYGKNSEGIKILFAGGDTEQQRRSIDAINNALKPLMGSSIYKDRLVVLIDKQNPRQQKHYEQFKKSYPFLYHPQQKVFELPHNTLEEYYPHPWRKTYEETKEMESKKKIQLAKCVADSIKRAIFECRMKEIHNALQECMNSAFKLLF